ncbi:TspO/MBR family protein [Rubinisphaera italica]|nr:TspO/MBR family protein [Rubinisphaera italica]
MPLSLFAVQLLLNIVWSWIFFGMHQPGWCICGDYHVVAVDFGNDDSLLQKAHSCRRFIGAVSDVGQNCERAERHDPAIESTSLME